MKTKMMIVWTLALIAIFAVNFANAQPLPPPGVSNSVPERLPIGSVAELQAYAWEQVANISEYGWASSSINGATNNKASVWLPYTPSRSVVDVEEVLGLISSQQLLLSVLHPSDMVSIGAGLYDKNGNNLFYGNAWGPIRSPGRSGVSSNILDLVLEMSDRAFLEYTDVSWFRIIERDSQGQPIRYYYPDKYGIQNGGFYIPAYFVGKLGELVITRSDGTEIAFSLLSGEKIRPVPVASRVGSVSVLGLRTFRGTNVAYVEITDQEFDRNINPLSQFVSQPAQQVYLAAWTKNPKTGEVGEFATAAYIWRQGQSSQTAHRVNIDPATNYAIENLPAGRFWIRYVFPTFGVNKNQFYPPYVYDGGGKG